MLANPKRWATLDWDDEIPNEILNDWEQCIRNSEKVAEM